MLGYNKCMPDISFEDNSFKFKSRTILSESTVPGLTRFLLKKGIVKNEKQANIFMIFMSIIFFLAAGFVFIVFVLGINDNNRVTKEQIEINRERLKDVPKPR